MLGRRSVFVLSVLISLGLHALLYWAAPRITLGRTIDTPERKKVREFHFHLRQEVPKPATPAPGTPDGGATASKANKSLSTRPGSVQDLLAREDETLNAGIGKNAPLPVAQMAERAAQEARKATPDLTPSDDSLRRADGKIVEIARADARSGLDIARRVVRPSPERFFASEEYPAIRSSMADPSEPLVRFEPIAGGLLAQSLAPGAAHGGAPDELAGEPGNAAADFDSDGLEPETVPLPTMIAKASAEQAKTAAIEETPYQFLDDLVEIALQTYRAPGEDSGYFRVQVKLRADAKAPSAPKDVIFLIDASSSMQQRKLDAVVAGVRDCLKTLRNEDRFNVVLFRDSTTPFQPQLVEGTKANVDAALAFLKKVPSKGETDVYNALQSVVATEAVPGRGSVLVVLSDGRPTAGLRDAREIINNVTAANTPRHAVLAYAGGNAIDRYLLELLAYRNRGAAAFAERIEDMKGGAPKFFAANASPILVNMQADFGGLDARSIFPRELPDFSATRPYEIYGRYTPAREKDFVMRLSGKSGQIAKDLVFKLRFDEAEKGGEEVAAGWAFQKSYALIADIAQRGDAPELLSELRGLGKKYGIRTVYSE